LTYKFHLLSKKEGCYSRFQRGESYFRLSNIVSLFCERFIWWFIIWKDTKL